MNELIDLKQLKVIIYLRKSSDSEDKQIASIPQQRKELLEISKRMELRIVDIVEETRSAFHPGRQKFNEIMQTIENGGANAVLCWNANRIARNTVDGGNFTYKIDTGKIKALITKGKIYLNTSEDKFSLSIDFSVAKKYSDDLSVVVHRGNKHKFFEKKEWGGPAKPGYLNVTDPITKENSIINNPVTFTLVKNALHLIVSGKYTPMETLSILNDEWGYRSRQSKKQGGLPMSKPTFYRILADSFYCGLMKRKINSVDSEIMGTHEPMLTEEEFEQLQVRLGRKGKSRRCEKEFAFKEVLKCGECEGAITAEEKWQVICPQCKKKFHKGVRTNECPQCHMFLENMKDPKILHYVFYHCTKRVHPDCTQGSMTLDNLKTKIVSELAKFEIDADYKDWAITYLNELNDKEEHDQTTIKNNLLVQLNNCDKQLRNLLREKIKPRDIESNSERETFYDEEEARLFKEKKNINKAIAEVDKKQEEWYVLSKETFEFAYYAQYRFEHGGAKTKTYILSKLGSNLVILGKDLLISQDKPFFLIEKGKKEVASIVASLEPAKKVAIASNLFAYEPISIAWRRGRDSNSR